MTQKIRILIVDDHPLVREGMANLINQQTDLEVCGGAASEPEALQLIGTLLPDIAIVDISLEKGSGIELVKNVKMLHPTVKTLVLSMHDEMLYAERALRAGARGYIMKREAATKVIAGIRAIHAGQLYISEKISGLLADKVADGTPSNANFPVEQLSDRELQVFELLGQGQTTRQIAGHLQVGFKTVQAYCARIKEKLGLTNATELLREAIHWQNDVKKNNENM